MAKSKSQMRSPKTRNLFSVEVRGYRDVMGRYSAAANECAWLRREGIEEMRLWTEVMLRDEAPVFRGDLRDQITSDIEPTKTDQVIVHFVVDGEAANYVHFVTGGRGPVTPKDPEGYLVYPTDPDENNWVFSKYSGPAMPDDFVQRAVDRMESNHYGPEQIAETVANKVQSVWNLYQTAE